MSTSEAPGQPTIADVIAELRLQRMESRTGFSELRSLVAELRAAQAELRADVAAVRGDLHTGTQDLRHQIGLLLDELAAFRAEYNGHTHDD